MTRRRPGTRAPIEHADARRRAPFGVYVHIPFCARRCDYCAFATWTDRDHLVDAYLDARRAPRSSGPSSRRPARRRPRCSSAAARRRWCRPTALDGGARRDPPTRRAPRSRSSATPTRSTAELLDAYAAGGVNRLSLRRAVDGAARARRARPHPRPGQRRAGGRASAREPGSTSFNLDLIYGGAGESLDDWRPTLERGARARPAPRQRLRPHRRGRAPRWPPTRPPSRRRRPGRQVPARRRALRRTGLEWYEISNWARPGHAVPAQPPLLGAGRLPRRSVAPPTRTAPGGGGGTCARPSATSRPSTRAGRPRAASEHARRRRPGASRGCSSRSATRRPGCRASDLLTSTARRPRRAAGRAGGAHRAGPAARQRGRAAPALRSSRHQELLAREDEIGLVATLGADHGSPR